MARDTRKNRVGPFGVHRRVVKVQGTTQFHLEPYILHQRPNESVKFLRLRQIRNPQARRAEPSDEIRHAFSAALPHRRQLIASAASVVLRPKLIAQHPAEIIPRRWSTVSFTDFSPPQRSIPAEQGSCVGNVAACGDGRYVQMLANLEQPGVQVARLFATVGLRFFNLH
ncbi:MAG: hypothetical protein OIF55_07215, partial [Amphritea sp.]|nr:hypothetical protein [Amphritea sp.]